jgi:hypothetical protein
MASREQRVRADRRGARPIEPDELRDRACDTSLIGATCGIRRSRAVTAVLPTIGVRWCAPAS